MNPRDRIFTAMYLEEPDRVPLFELAVNAIVAEKIVGKRYPPIQTNPPWPEMLKMKRETLVEKCVEGHLLCYRKLGIDMLSVFPSPPRDFKPEIPEPNMIVDEWGAKYKYVPETDQAFVVEYPIKRPEDLETYTFPDPHAPGRTDVPEMAVKMAEKYNMPVSCWLPGICEFVVANLLGLVTFSVFLHRYPSLLEKILDEVTRFNIELGKALIDVGVEVIWFGNDTANKNGPFLPPRLHRKYFAPRLKKMVETFHKRGAFVFHHSCGYNWDLLDDFVWAGVDVLHPFEPQAGMDIVKGKEVYGDKVCIAGNIDVAYTLSFGTPEDVEKEVKQRIKELAPGGGYILTSSNSIFKAIPPENAIAMFKAGKKYGDYTRI